MTLLLFDKHISEKVGLNKAYMIKRNFEHITIEIVL